MDLILRLHLPTTALAGFQHVVILIAVRGLCTWKVKQIQLLDGQELMDVGPGHNLLKGSKSLLYAAVKPLSSTIKGIFSRIYTLFLIGPIRRTSAKVIGGLGQTIGMDPWTLAGRDWQIRPLLGKLAALKGISRHVNTCISPHPTLLYLLLPSSNPHTHNALLPIP